MNRRRLLAVGLAMAAASCGKKKVAVIPPPQARQPGQPSPPVPTVPPAAPPPGTTEAGVIERGLASWYGHPYHGRPAADGEIYDMETMVAAHRTLAFQTWVRVKNVSNGRTVDVRIIDRGPFVNGRVIDLSHAAAKEIELIGPGVAQVELTMLSLPPNPEPALFAVQVGAFREKANADRMEQAMRSLYGAARQVLRAGDPAMWRILAGREISQDSAASLALRIRTEQKVPEAFVVRLDP